MDIGGSLIITLGINSKGLDAAAARVKQFETSTAASMQRVKHSFDSAAHSMRYFGKDMSMYVTLPMVLAGATAIKMGMDFEASLQKIVGLVDVAQKQVDDWGAELLKLGPEIGVGPKALADALYYVTSSGFKSAEALDITTQSAKAAVSGLGETKAIADLVTSAMNAYKNSNLSARESIDILTVAVREGKGEASEYARQMGDVIPVASKMGVSFDQVAAAMSAITLTGSSVSETATQIRQVLVSLLDPARESEKALKAMGASSMELRNMIIDKGLLAGLMRVGELSNKYGEDIMGKVFPNVRALTGVLSLLGDRLEENKLIFIDTKNATGASSAAYGIAAATLKNKWERAVESAHATMISFTLAMKSTLIPALDAVSSAFKTVAIWINSLSESERKALFYTLAITAAIGPLTIAITVVVRVFSMFVGILSKVITALSAMSAFTLANPWIALGIAVVAVAGYFLLFSKNADGATEAQKRLNEAIGKGQELSNSIAPIETRVYGLVDMGKSQLEALRESIHAQLRAEEDYTVDLKAELRKRIQESEVIAGFEKQIDETKLDVLRANMVHRIQIEKETIAKELNESYKGNQARISLLDSYLKAVNQRLAYKFPATKKEKQTKSLDMGGASGAIDQVKKAMDDMATSEKYITLMTGIMGDAFDDAAAKMNLYKQVLEDLVKAGEGAGSSNVNTVITKIKSVDTAAAAMKKVSRDLAEELQTIDNIIAATGGTTYAGEDYLKAYTTALETLGRKGITAGGDIEKYKKKIGELNTEIENTQPLIAYGKEMDWIVKQKEIYGSAFDGVSASISAQERLLYSYVTDTIPDAEQGVKELTADLIAMNASFKEIEHIKAWGSAFSELSSGLQSLASATGNEMLANMSKLSGSVDKVFSSMAKLKEIQVDVSKGAMTSGQGMVATAGSVAEIVAAAVAAAQAIDATFRKPRKMTALENFIKNLDIAISRLKLVKQLMDKGLIDAGNDYKGDLNTNVNIAATKVKELHGTTDVIELTKKLAEQEKERVRLAEMLDQASDGLFGGEKYWKGRVSDNDAAIAAITSYLELLGMSQDAVNDQIESEKELAQTRKDAAEAAEEALNKTAFMDPQSMSQAIVDAFTSGMQEAVDKGIKPMFGFAKTIKDLLRNAIIQSMSLIILEPLMQKLRTSIAEDMTGNESKINKAILDKQKVLVEIGRLAALPGISELELTKLADYEKTIVDDIKALQALPIDLPGLDNSQGYIDEFVAGATKFTGILDTALAKAGLGFEKIMGDTAKANLSEALSSGIEEGLQNGDKFIDIWGKSLNKIVRNQIISALSMKFLMPLIDRASIDIGTLISNPFEKEQGDDRFTKNILPYIQSTYGEGSDFAGNLNKGYDVILKIVRALGLAEDGLSDLQQALSSSLSSGIKEGLQNGGQFVDVFGKTMNDVLKNAVIDAMSLKMLQPMIDGMTTGIVSKMENYNHVSGGASNYMESIVGDISEKYGKDSDFYKNFQTKFDIIKKVVKGLFGETEETFSDLHNALADALSSGIEQGLLNGTSFVNVFATTMNDALRNAVMNAMSLKMLQPMIDAMSADIAKKVEGQGKISDTIAYIKNKYGEGSDFYKKFKTNYDVVQGAVNSVSMPGAQAKGLEGAIKGVTEETAGLIAGQFNALRVTAIKIEKNTAVLHEIRDLMKGDKKVYANELRENGW